MKKTARHKNRKILEVELVNKHRKKPHQSRSIAMVEALKIAARELLAREGREALTLQKLSEYSGVSSSSIYEYFPTIDSLVVAIFQDDWQQEIFDKTETISNLPDTASLYDGIVLMLTTILNMRQKYIEIDPDAEARSVEYEELLRLGLVKGDDSPQLRMSLVLIERFRDEITVTDLDKAQYIMYQTAQALNRIMALEKPKYLTEKDTITQIANMFQALLTGSSGGSQDN